MPNNKEKILLFDFDGTLHNHGVVLPETYEALEYARKKGCKLFINTGRTKFGLLQDLDNILKFRFDGILCGGSSMYTGKNYENVVFEQSTLSPELLDKCLRYIRDYSYWGVIEGNNGIYSIEQHGEITYSPEEREEFYQKALKACENIKPFKLAIYPPRGIEAVLLNESLPEFDWTCYPHLPGYEGFLKGCGKDTIIYKMSKILDIPTENIISFGDSENDIPAFRAAGKSVAMTQSHEAVKDAATFTATTPAGVAEGIYHYIK